MYKEKIAAAFNRGAPTYGEYARHQQEWAHELLKLLPDKHFLKILDLGCGDGFLLKELSLRFPLAELTGLDISPGMIKRAEEKLSQVKDLKLIKADMERWEENEQFDLILSNASFQWIEDPKAMVNKIEHSLSPGGHFIFCTLGPQSLKQWRELYDSAFEYPDFRWWQENLQNWHCHSQKSFKTRLGCKNLNEFHSYLKGIGATAESREKQAFSRSLYHTLRNLDFSSLYYECFLFHLEKMDR